MFYKHVDGKRVELTPEEIANMQAEAGHQEREYWQSISYEEGVHLEFRKEFTQQAVEAIQNNYFLDPNNPKYAAEMKYMQERRAAIKAFVKQKKEEYADGCD